MLLVWYKQEVHNRNDEMKITDLNLIKKKNDKTLKRDFFLY